MSDTDQSDLINNVLAEEEAPRMVPPLELSVTLIKGIFSEERQSNVVDAHLRELNGEDEEALTILGEKEGIAYGDYITAVLGRSVERIGDVPIKDPKVLDTLINADRDILFLQTMRATYGKEKTVQAICPSCGKKNDVVIDLDDDFPVTYPDFAVNAPITVKGRRGDLYAFNLPTGADTTAAAEAKTDAEANTIIVGRCAVFPKGDEPADRVAWARALNLSDRHKIVDRLLSIELGPKLGAVDTHCAHCEVEMPIALNWVSLLLG